MITKYVIGLDVSTHTGIALLGPDRRGEIGQIDLTGFGMWRAVQMTDKIREWLSPVVTLPKMVTDFAVAVVEQPAYAAKGGEAHNVQNELNAVARYWLHVNGIESVTAAPNTLKKFATLNGNAKKPDMVNAAEQELFRQTGEFITLTDNEADAFWLARFGWQLFDPRDDDPAADVVAAWSKRNLKQLEIARLFT